MFEGLTLLERSNFYKGTSMKSIRDTIDRFLRSPPQNKPFCIIADPAVTQANEVLDAGVREIKKDGKNCRRRSQYNNFKRADEETLPQQRTRTTTEYGLAVPRPLFWTKKGT